MVHQQVDHTQSCQRFVDPNFFFTVQEQKQLFQELILVLVSNPVRLSTRIDWFLFDSTKESIRNSES